MVPTYGRTVRKCAPVFTHFLSLNGHVLLTLAFVSISAANRRLFKSVCHQKYCGVVFFDFGVANPADLQLSRKIQSW